jgi:hypothetical protein
VVHKNLGVLRLDLAFRSDEVEYELELEVVLSMDLSKTNMFKFAFL